MRRRDLRNFATSVEGTCRFLLLVALLTEIALPRRAGIAGFVASPPIIAYLLTAMTLTTLRYDHLTICDTRFGGKMIVLLPVIAGVTLLLQPTASRLALR